MNNAGMTNADPGADIRADPPATPRSARPPRRVWPWVLGGALLFTLLAAGSVAALLLTAFDGLRDHAHVVINGQPWNWGGDWGSDFGGDWSGIWSDGDSDGGFLGGLIGFIVGTACVVLAGLLVVVIVVPIVALVVGFVGLAVAFVVAAVLGSVGLVAALVLSPLWLFALLLWLVFRRRPQRAVA